MQDKAAKYRRLRGKFLYVAATADSSASASETVRNKVAKDSFVALQGVNSLYEVFQRSVAQWPDNKCLGRRVADVWVWETYKTVAEKVAAVASALAAVGATAHTRAGIYSVNCPEWMVAMQACNRMTIYTVPLYDTFGKDAVRYIVTHSESRVVFVSTANWSKLISALPDLQGLVHTLVYWGTDEVDREAAIKEGVKVFSWQEFLEAGRAKLAEPVPPGPDDLCTIMYTSGTTGVPKGVMLTHRMVMHCIAAQEHIAYQADGLVPCNENDVILSWLPLSHIMERSAEEFMLYVGARIGYYSGSVTKLMGDILSLRPTLFIAPPRVWDRVYAGTMAKLNQPRLLNWMLRALFNYAYSYKLRQLKQDVPFFKASPFFDRLVFAHTRAALGGRVRIALSGSAPLAAHVEEFMRVTMCCHFAQGYGLTETCASSFYSSSTEWESFGTVGVPSATLEYRLESIPEMNYNALGQPPRGEICIRGPTVFLGYWKDPERTAEVIDKDSWFHTGDVGEIADSGALKVIDRKKQIFKLAQGEYVAPFKIESAYDQLALISQIFVHGNMTESRLVAVVVPEEAAFMEAARHEGLSGSLQKLVQEPRAEAMLLSKMQAVADTAGLKGFERVMGLVLEPEAWSVDNGLLTPTLKAKRRELLAKYQLAINRLYLRMDGKGS